MTDWCHTTNDKSCFSNAKLITINVSIFKKTDQSCFIYALTTIPADAIAIEKYRKLVIIDPAVADAMDVTESFTKLTISSEKS